MHQANEFALGLGLEFVRNEAVAAVAAGFAEISHWTGVAHLDMRIDSRTGQPVLIEVNPRYWGTLLGSLAMSVDFPDMHCRLAFGLPLVPAQTRTGFYLDGYSLLISPRNVVVLARRGPGFLRHIDRRIVFADPRVETGIVFRTLKRIVTKAGARAGQTFRRGLGGRGHSSQLR